jgi:hypothetical protein
MPRGILCSPYKLESLIAEKFQVLVSWAEANTRMEDFYDLAFLAGRFPFDGVRLASALLATFKRRGIPFCASGEDVPVLGPAFYGDQATLQQ